MWATAKLAHGLVGRRSSTSLMFHNARGSNGVKGVDCYYCLESAVCARNDLSKALPFSTRVFTPYMQNRLFSSSNGVIGAATTLQPKPGTPVHQGKMPFIDAFLFKMKDNPRLLMNKKIWSRRSMILPEFVNCNVRIYNGKNFIRRKITEAMVGHKFGEFAFTRKRMKLKTNAPGKKKAKR